MVFLLIFQGVMGWVIAGQFADEASCTKAAHEVLGVMEEQESRRPKAMKCVGFPEEMPQPRQETNA